MVSSLQAASLAEVNMRMDSSASWVCLFLKGNLDLLSPWVTRNNFNKATLKEDCRGKGLQARGRHGLPLC